MVKLHKCGESNGAIVKELKATKVMYEFVYNIVSRYKEIGSTLDNTCSICPVCQDNEPCKMGQGEDPQVPRKEHEAHARDDAVDPRTMRRIVKDDLGFIPYKKVRGQLLSAATKAQRLVRSCLLLKELRSSMIESVIRSDQLGRQDQLSSSST